MSADEAAAEAPEDAGESDGMSERTAKTVLLLVAGSALAGVIIAFPYMAYFVAGLMTSWSWQKARGWIGRRGTKDEPEGDEVTLEDLVETLHELAAPNVFLADLAEAFGLSGADARALLESYCIRIRRAVRNGPDTGVGVHREDVPPLPRPLSEPPERGVDLHNQRPTVEAIGLAGVVVKDGSENSRQYRIQ